MFLFSNDSSKKYQKFGENPGAMVIIPNRLEIFCGQDTEIF